MTTPSRCWCGNSALEPFSPDYLRCGVCTTLVVARMPAREALKVTGDEKGIYGRDYWFRHQKDDLGYPDLEERARLDLPERCLHWLKTLLSAKLPPARVLEIGCAHGGFVALMQAAGFDAIGLELSPFVVRFAQETFLVPVLLGPVEDQHLRPASFDAIVMSDVLEHLPDPVGTLTRCTALLKDDGVLVVQTPLYMGEVSAEELLTRGDRFLTLLQPQEHLFLFSEAAVRRALATAGLMSTRFEQALFDYDQFLLAAKSLPDPIPAGRADEALGSSPSGRLVRALLDKEGALHSLVARLQACEEDRAARLAVIESQGARIGAFTGQLQTCEEDRAARLAVIESQDARIGDLTRQLQACEDDRVARLAVIDSQGAHIGALSGQLQACEKDRVARLAVIESQGARIGDLTGQLQACEDGQAARLAVIESQDGRIDALVRAIEAAYPRSHLGLAFRSEVTRIRRVLGDALGKN